MLGKVTVLNKLQISVKIEIMIDFYFSSKLFLVRLLIVLFLALQSDNDQESKLHNKVLKISEDRNSPLFIPTKGNFYQHDVRSDSGSGR